MTQALAERDGAALMEKVVVGGDLSQLSPGERLSYYRQLCESLGLNWLTKPFEYLELGTGSDRKLVLYPRRDATDQLRKINSVSITRLERERMEDCYVVTAYARASDGREDSAMGAVPLTKENGEWATAQSGKRYLKTDGTFSPLTGEALANAIMKAETKAKRRVTLSLCGLGWTDESEIESISSVRTVVVDHQTGEVIEERPNPTNARGARTPVAAPVATVQDAQSTPAMITSIDDKVYQRYVGMMQRAAAAEIEYEAFGVPVERQKVVDEGMRLKPLVEAAEQAAA